MTKILKETAGTSDFKLEELGASAENITGEWTWNTFIEFDETATPATPAAGKLRLHAADAAGAHTFLQTVDADGHTNDLGRDLKHVVRNDSGATITKGAPLYITGSVGNVAQVEMAVADANNLDRAEVAGVADEDILDNGFGLMVQYGDLTGVDLSAFTEGDDLYLSGTPGALSATAPAAPAPRVQIGTVLKATAAGTLFVNPRLDVLESDYTRRSVDETITQPWTFSGTSQVVIDFDRTGSFDGIVHLEGGAAGVGSGGGISFEAFGDSLAVLRGYILDASNAGTGFVTLGIAPDGFSSTHDEVMRWTRPGNVLIPRGKLGIGTPGTPGAALDIYPTSDGAVAQRWFTSGGRALSLVTPIHANTNDPFIFSTANAISFQIDGVTEFSITAGGDVGIGTTSPAEKLDVDGNIKLTGNIKLAGAIQSGLTDFIRDNKPRRIIDANGYHPGLTITNSNGTRVNSQGFIEAVPDNTLRIDHDPLTGAVIGPLIEESRTNEALHSSDVTDAVWSKGAGVSVTGNTDYSPSGIQDADTVDDISATGNPLLWQLVSIPADSSTWTYSRWFKAGTAAKTIHKLSLTGGTAVNQDTTIDWATRTVSGGGVILEDDGTWMRVAVSVTNNGTNTSAQSALFPASFVSGGTTTGTVKVWNAQIENGPTATSDIETTTAAVTRAADNILLDGAPFGQMWNPDEGTIVVEAAADSVSGSDAVVSADDATNSDRIQIYWRDASGDLTTVAVDGGITQDISLIKSYTIGQAHRIAYAFSENNFATSADGETVETDNAGTIPTVTQLVIGSGASLGQFNGHIRQLTYYPKRLTNAELEMISVVGRDILGEWGKAKLSENVLADQFLTKKVVHALTDVTTTGQTRTLDVANGPVQTISAEEDFTLDATGPSGQLTEIWLYVFVPTSSANSTVSVLAGSAVQTTSGGRSVLYNNTALIPCKWDGANLWMMERSYDGGDLRPT